jgi:hypothetical protein
MQAAIDPAGDSGADGDRQQACSLSLPLVIPELLLIPLVIPERTKR